MGKFLDRIDERKIFDKAIDKINAKKDVMVWIDGESGVGKSYLLRHSLTEIACPIFEFMGYKKVYKCDKQDLSQEFSFISVLLTTLQSKNPKAFQKTIYNYFEEHNYIHLFEALEAVIPNIPVLKWSKEIFDKYNCQTQESKNFIADKTLKPAMILCFSEIILQLLELYYKESNILFCIDDMIWMDISSLRTLETILSKVRNDNGYTISISLIITTRNRESLEHYDKATYDKIETDFLNELFSFNYQISLKNFKLTTIREAIYEENRYSLIKYIESIYRITEGNPQELTQTLKFEDQEIIKRINDVSINNEVSKQNANYFTRELLETLSISNEYALLIISIASIVEKHLNPQLLLTLCINCAKQINKKTFNYVEYENAIALLKEKNILAEDDFIYVKHDSTKSLMIEYLYETGDIELIGNTITECFINDTLAKDEYYFSRIKVALNILKSINPHRCFEVFVQLISEDSRNYSLDNVEIVATSICRCFKSINILEINNVVIPKLLQTLVSTAKYHTANNLCELLYFRFNEISTDNKIIYLTCYAKVLIDLGLIKENNQGKPCAIDVVDTLINQPQNDSELLLAYLLKMSAHEHVLEFNEIKEVYNKANEIVNQNNSLNLVSLSKFYRNKGLVTFHSELEENYLKAYKYASQIEEANLCNIMKGTCQNNLGLSYFYQGEIQKALQCFEKAYTFLSLAGYDLLRVTNNISVCYFMMGDYENSYKYITLAKSIPLKGVFEAICVDVNLSLNMYKRGQVDEAKERLTHIIKEYEHKSIQTDTVAYSAAAINRGYINFLEGNYLDAYKLFKASKKHKYKNADELEQKKRDALCSFSLYKENITSNLPEEYIDFSETTNNIFKRPYSLILLAFYVI